MRGLGELANMDWLRDIEEFNADLEWAVDLQFFIESH